MSGQCPSCGRGQDQGLLCAEDSTAVMGMLAAVPQLVEQLEVAISRQARVGGGGRSGKGTARESNPINFGALDARDQLLVAVAFVGDDIDALRKHPQVAELVSDLGKTVRNAYRCIDRAQDRTYLGVCMFTEGDATCHAEVWARAGAKEVTCSQCGVVHEVAERRAWLLLHAADTICTVREASQWLGDVGGIPVTQDRIRGYVKRKRLAYRPGGTMIRLGDLLELVTEETGRRTA